MGPSRKAGSGHLDTERLRVIVYHGGFDWGALYKDYVKFHNRQVARTVSSGTPEVTAKIIVLEDLGSILDRWFDAAAPDGDTQPIKTLVMDELTHRKNLTSSQSPSWPPVQDGPLEGVLTTDIAMDREGKVREIGVIVSDNPGMDDVARRKIAAMQFSPVPEDGMPVQVFSCMTLAFKTTRPQGTETFESARTWFERGRKGGFLASSASHPYVIRVDFQAASRSGEVVSGHYEDTWISDSQWRRDATFGASRFVRSRNGNKIYRLVDGPDAGLLAVLFQILETHSRARYVC